MSKVWIGIDNGVTGSISILGDKYSDFLLTPTFVEQNYTKAKNNITRVEVNKFKKILEDAISKNEVTSDEVMVIMERPLVNPTRFVATCSALRALEAELCTIESLGIPHMYIDSKEWQRKYLPAGLKGSPEQKKASHDIGCRMFPQFKELIEKHKDADGLFIALYCKQKFN